MAEAEPQPWNELHILDTETAGFSGGVCELAYLKVDRQLNILEEFHTLVNPEREIDPGATAIHGITNAEADQAPTLAEVAAEKLAKPIYLVAHNASFDKRMITPTVTVESVLCTLKLSRQYLATAESHKLENLQSYLNLPPQKSHSALGDVHTVRDLLLYIVSNYGLSFDTIVSRNDVPKLVHKMPFGAHKGKALNKLAKDYRAWLLEQPDIDKDLRYSLNLLKDI